MIYDLPFAVEPMYEREISEIEKFKVGGLLLQARILINFQREREKNRDQSISIMCSMQKELGVILPDKKP